MFGIHCYSKASTNFVNLELECKVVGSMSFSLLDPKSPKKFGGVETVTINKFDVDSIYINFGTDQFFEDIKVSDGNLSNGKLISRIFDDQQIYFKFTTQSPGQSIVTTEFKIDRYSGLISQNSKSENSNSEVNGTCQKRQKKF